MSEAQNSGQANRNGDKKGRVGLKAFEQKTVGLEPCTCYTKIRAKVVLGFTSKHLIVVDSSGGIQFQFALVVRCSQGGRKNSPGLGQT